MVLSMDLWQGYLDDWFLLSIDASRKPDTPIVPFASHLRKNHNLPQKDYERAIAPA
jgi:hypothetical protein